MVMNKKLQRINLERSFNKMGIAADVIDLHAEIDSSLSYRENKTILNKKARLLADKEFNNSYGRLSSWELTEKAREIQENRSYRSQSLDHNIRAKKTFFPDNLTKKEFKKWKKNPNRYDIETIDTEGSYY